MAVKTGTRIFISPNIFGRYKVSCVQMDSGIGAAAAWLPRSVHGIKEIKCAWVHVNAQNGPGEASSVVVNAQGTGSAEGSSDGDLGIETTGAATLHVFVVGR